MPSGMKLRDFWKILCLKLVGGKRNPEQKFCSWSGRMDVALAVSSLPSAATKGALTRNRGPTLTDRRAAEEAAAMEKEKERAAARARAAQAKEAAIVPVASAAVAAAARPSGAGDGSRGRAAMNAPVKLGGGVQNVEDRKASLMEKAETRPYSKVTSVAPTGAGKLDELPDREDFELETEDGAAALAEAMFEFVDENFDTAGIEARSADQHECKTGFFGYWHKKRGHGECVEWVEVENGWESSGQSRTMRETRSCRQSRRRWSLSSWCVPR